MSILADVLKIILEVDVVMEVAVGHFCHCVMQAIVTAAALPVQIPRLLLLLRLWSLW